MGPQDKEFINSSLNSGKKYGYPICCINAFVAQPPSQLKLSGNKKDNELRFKMGHLNGTFTGFIPCLIHAKQIQAGKIKLVDLIDEQERTVPAPFPNDWSLK